MSTATLSPRTRRKSAGQSLVEFSLILPIFMVIVLGLIDGGRLIYMNSVLSQSAREAARVVSVEASWIGSTDPSCNTSGGPVCPATFNAMLADAVAAANRMVTPFGTIPTANVYLRCDVLGSAPTGNWTGTPSCSSSSTGSVVSIHVVMTYTAITPVVGQVIPSIELAGYASMVIN